MNSVSVPRNRYLSRDYTQNSLSVLRIYFEFTFFFANSLWIYNLYRKATMNSLCFFAHSLSITRIDYEFIVFIPNLVRIHVVFLGFTLNSLYFWRIHFQSTIFFMISLWIHLIYDISYIANSLWIHYIFSRIHFPLFFVISLRTYLIYRGFTNYKANLPPILIVWIYYLYREFSENSRALSRKNFEFTIYFTVLL